MDADTFEGKYNFIADDTDDKSVNHTATAQILQPSTMEQGALTRFFTTTDLTPPMHAGVNLRKILSLPLGERRSLEKTLKARIDGLILEDSPGALKIIQEIHTMFDFGPIDIYPSKASLPAKLQDKSDAELSRFVYDEPGVRADPVERMTVIHYLDVRKGGATGKVAIYAYVRVLLEILAKSNEQWGIPYTL